MGDAPKVHHPHPIEFQTANWLLSCGTVTTRMEETPGAVCPPWSTSRDSKAHTGPIATLVVIVGCDLSKDLNHLLLISASSVSNSRPTLGDCLRNMCAVEWNTHPNHPPKLASPKPESLRPHKKALHMSTIVDRRQEGLGLNLCCALTKCQAYGFQMLFYLNLQAAP